jgi:eukaryotic-like serine/threonine-protein kinase
MPLSDGTRLGSYEILSALGAGGMGEVYRARDTRLDRAVAIKVVPHAFVADPERVARFQREAKVLASLNHPHIAAIYGLEEAEHVTALVMELVEGEDLAQRLTRGPIPLDEALPIASQIAEALGAAHERGIIHRDLKPANIKLRPDGTVKVLDFGLAKAIVGDAKDLLESPTVTGVATRAGTILGTAPYMSPEQAKGRPVDRRTDLWAFGVVLYELLAGTRPFQGESVAEILSHVLTETPNWALLPAATPAPIRTLLRRCLEKNPARRLDSAVALRLEIDEALVSPGGVMAVGGSEARRRRFTWEAIAALVGTSLVVALGTWVVVRNDPSAPALPVRFTITFPPTEPMELTFRGRDIALSPDGRYLAYQSRGRLMLRAFDQLGAVPLAGVSGGRTPFFSPDSRWIGFFDGSDLKKVAITGGRVIPLSRELGSPNGGSWGDDGTIVVSSEDGNFGLRRVSADGGEATELTRTEAAHLGHGSPSMLPGSRGVLFTIGANAPEDRHLAVLDLKSGEQKTLLRGGAAAEYLDTGHLVYATFGSQGSDVSGTLWVVGFDLNRLELVGEPVRVSETLQIDMLSAVNYAVSRTGALAYVPARARTRSFVWVDRTGRETVIDGLPPRAYANFGLSPDGTRVAFSVEDGEFDVFVWDFARESLTRLTFGSSFDYLPRWTPDGRRIIFQSNREGSPNLFSVPSDGSGPVERLTTSTNHQYPNSITPDGTTLLFCELRPKTGFDILRLPLPAAFRVDGTATAVPDERLSETTPLVASLSAEYAANISPDGRYFAYQSAESGGRFAVYVQPYPDVSKGRWQISTDVGLAPVWARTGRELFYLDDSYTLMAVTVQTSGGQFIAGRPVKVFDTKTSGDFYSYDVTPDGRRFLMTKESTAGDRNRPPNMVVVLNWQEELKARVPTQ